MDIELKVDGAAAVRELQHFAEFRADYALGAMRDQIGLISSSVDGVGETDDEIRCRVTIRRTAQPDLTVEGTHGNPYVAIHQALDEAGWSLARGLMHQHSGMLQRQIELIGDGLRKASLSAAAGQAA